MAGQVRPRADVSYASVARPHAAASSAAQLSEEAQLSAGAPQQLSAGAAPKENDADEQPPPSKSPRAAEDEGESTPMLGDDDLLDYDEPETQPSAEASGAVATHAPAEAPRARNRKEPAAPSDITDNLLQMELHQRPPLPLAGEAAASAAAQPSAGAHPPPALQEVTVAATIGGEMSAKQKAVSRVAAGIVLPQDYRTSAATAVLAEEQLPDISSTTNPMRPPPSSAPPPELQPSVQDYQWVALEPEADRPFDLSALGSQVEMEMDEVDIQYDRQKLRIKYEDGRRGTILCLIPPEASAYFLEEGSMSFADEHENETLFKVSKRGDEGEKLERPPMQDRHQTWEGMKQKVRQERAASQGKGIRIRYDMPNYLAKTSLRTGGFAPMQEAIGAPLTRTCALLNKPPQVSWSQPKDRADHYLNSLDLWLNSDTTAEAANMDYSPMKYVIHRQGSDPLRGYMSSQTCTALQIRQCCFRPVSSPRCPARDGGTCDARRNARAAAGYSTPSDGPQMTFRQARQDLKRERETETEIAIQDFKMQRKSASQDKLCEDYKAGKCPIEDCKKGRHRGATHAASIPCKSTRGFECKKNPCPYKNHCNL